MSREIFVLSDIHLGVGWDSDWYQKKKHDDQLIEILGTVKKRGAEAKVELVLAGDVFDTWLCPMDKEPPTIRQILDHNSNIINELTNCLESVENIYYINGNHDMHVAQEDLEEISIGPKKIQRINEYRSGLIKIEHGHRYAMFNAKDKMNDPLHGLPIGYFITRILSGDDSYDKPGAIASYIDDLLEAAFTTQTISSSVIEALTEHVRKKPEDTFKMPFGRQDLTIGDVMKKYKNLFDLWVDKYGYMYSINAIRAEMGSLNWFADRLSKKHDYKVVVMGHTHDSKVDEDRLFLRDDRIYANAGYWATERPSYVHIEKNAGDCKVSLFEKSDGGKFVCNEYAET